MMLREERVRTERVGGGKGARSLGRPGKAWNMRIGARLLIVFGLLLAFTNTTYAGEWKKHDYSETKIELRLNWGWTASEQGRHFESWNDSHNQHYYSSSWNSGNDRIEISLRRLAPFTYWRSFSKINEKWLNWWHHLRKVGASEMTTISCAVRYCVTFKAGHQECVGFKYVAGTQGTKNEGDQGSDLVAGFYCPTTPAKGADKLDEILKSIVIRK